MGRKNKVHETSLEQSKPKKPLHLRALTVIGGAALVVGGGLSALKVPDLRAEQAEGKALVASPSDLHTALIDPDNFNKLTGSPELPLRWAEDSTLVRGTGNMVLREGNSVQQQLVIGRDVFAGGPTMKDVATYPLIAGAGVAAMAGSAVLGRRKRSEEVTRQQAAATEEPKLTPLQEWEKQQEVLNNPEFQRRLAAQAELMAIARQPVEQRRMALRQKDEQLLAAVEHAAQLQAERDEHAADVQLYEELYEDIRRHPGDALQG